MTYYPKSGWDINVPFLQASKYDRKHSQAKCILRLHGHEFSLFWAFKIRENETFTMEVLFSRGSSWVGLLTS